MGRVSPGMLGGVLLISSRSRARARVTRGLSGWASSTLIASVVQVMTPARPRMIRVGVDDAGGEFRGDLVPCGLGCVEGALGPGDRLAGRGDQGRVFGGGADGGVGEHDGHVAAGGGEG